VPVGPTFVDVDCPLESLPKAGGIAGMVKDADSGAPVGGATVKLTDANGREFTVTANGAGSFAQKDLPPGPITIKVEAQGYMVHAEQQEIRLSETTAAQISMNKRPKTANVRIEGKEIRISKQIHFDTDSAKILGDSNSLLEEIADVIEHHQGIRKIEIQGHTDNTGTRDHNQTLSDQRANSVRTWLINAGVEPSRLTAKGYGQERPLAPNVTAANKARNRRVQFIIVEGK
jgi:outer membrane protein OmpA-like peptidoglycan-associated protein